MSFPCFCRGPLLLDVHTIALEVQVEKAGVLDRQSLKFSEFSCRDVLVNLN